MPRIPLSKIKTLPDIFKHITYKEVAEAIGTKTVTLRSYVNVKPEKFRLEDVYKMSEYLECDGWWLLKLVHGWMGERAD